MKNEHELFENLQHLQAKVIDRAKNSNSSSNFFVTGLHEVQKAISQAIQSYNHLHDLCDHLTKSQQELNQTALQVEQVKQLFNQALSVINFNLSQIQTNQSLSQDCRVDLEALQKNMGRLEGLVKDITAQTNRLTVPQQQNIQENKPEWMQHILDQISLASKAQQSSERKSGKCLIIDPNPNTAESIQRRLAHEGHEVFTVSDQASAQKTIEKNDIDVVLIDINAAKNEYKEFFTALLSSERLTYIPLIVMGTLNQLDELGHMMEAGAEDFLIKPLNAVLLKFRVHESIERKFAYNVREAQRRESNRIQEELKEAITYLTDGFVAFDTNRRLLMYNQKIFDTFPHMKNMADAEELNGMSIEEWLKALLEAGVIDFSHFSEEEIDDAHQDWYNKRLDLFAAPATSWDEKLLTGQVLHVTSYRTADGGTVLILKDETERHADQQRLAYMAYHDALTGLANREQFFVRLKQAISQPGSEDKGVAVLFMDLDGFKDVNDKYGHDLGDWLLVQVSERLRHCIRDRDVVARFGGDEFAAIMHNATYPKDLIPILERLINVVSMSFRYNEIDLQVGISIGVAIFPHNSRDIDELISQADAAMYAAKQGGRGTYRFYSNDDEMLKPSVFLRTV